MPERQAGGALGGGEASNLLLNHAFSLKQLHRADADIAELIISSKAVDDSGQFFEPPNGVLG